MRRVGFGGVMALALVMPQASMGQETRIVTQPLSFSVAATDPTGTVSQPFTTSRSFDASGLPVGFHWGISELAFSGFHDTSVTAFNTLVGGLAQGTASSNLVLRYEDTSTRPASAIGDVASTRAISCVGPSACTAITNDPLSTAPRAVTYLAASALSGPDGTFPYDQVTITSDLFTQGAGVGNRFGGTSSASGTGYVNFTGIEVPTIYLDFSGTQLIAVPKPEVLGIRDFSYTIDPSKPNRAPADLQNNVGGIQDQIILEMEKALHAARIDIPITTTRPTSSNYVTVEFGQNQGALISLDPHGQRRRFFLNGYAYDVSTSALALQPDRFNRREDGTVAVLETLERDPRNDSIVTTSLRPAKEIAEIALHEVLHAYGIVHLVDSNVPNRVEDYNWLGPRQVGADTGDLQITDVTVSRADGERTAELLTHNPAFHVRQYVLGESPQDLRNEGLVPGDWEDQSKLEQEYLTSISLPYVADMLWYLQTDISGIASSTDDGPIFSSFLLNDSLEEGGILEFWVPDEFEFMLYGIDQLDENILTFLFEGDPNNPELLLTAEDLTNPLYWGVDFEGNSYFEQLDTMFFDEAFAAEVNVLASRQIAPLPDDVLAPIPLGGPAGYLTAALLALGGLGMRRRRRA